MRNRFEQPRIRRTALAAAIAAFVAAPPAFAAPGDPLAPPFTVASIHFGDAKPIVRRDAAGNFLVVWSDSGVHAQLFNADGSARSAAFSVGSAGVLPSAAMDTAGDFVITWSGIDASFEHVYAQRYTAAGAAVGARIDVKKESVYSTSVAMDGDGDFVVAWAQDFQLFLPDGLGPYGSLEIGASSVRAKRYAHDGSTLGAEILVDLSLVNPTPLGGSYYPQDPVVAMNPAGNFVIAWQENVLPNIPAIYVRRYGPKGLPLGLGQRVNPLLQLTAYEPSVAIDNAGDFVVAWSVPHNTSTGLTHSSSGYDIYAQRYAKTGLPGGKAVKVSQNVSILSEPGPALVMDAAGGYAVAWTGAPNSCCVPRSLRLQPYSASGAAVGGNQIVVGDTELALGAPGLAMDAQGNMVMAWTFNGVVQAELLSGH